MRFGAGDPVGGGFARILKADLDVVESGVDQRLQTIFVEAEAGGDEVGVESGGAGGGDEFGQVRTGQRFAAGEVRVQHAELRRTAGRRWSTPRSRVRIAWRRVPGDSNNRRSAAGSGA